MDTLLEINSGKGGKDSSSYKLRKAARGVLFDELEQVPILFVSKDHYHKIPGGGIDDMETPQVALKREAREEVGCEIEVLDEIGKVVEYWEEERLKQISYCYIGRITLKGKPDFTKEEEDRGFEVVWLSLDEAISQLESDNPVSYEGRHIVERDVVFLKKARELKGKYIK